MTRRPDGLPETERDARFFDLRESGYTGPIDQDGNAVDEGWIDNLVRRGTDYFAKRTARYAGCCGCGGLTIRFVMLDGSGEPYCGDCAPFDGPAPGDFAELDPEIHRMPWGEFDELVEQIERAR